MSGVHSNGLRSKAGTNGCEATTTTPTTTMQACGPNCRSCSTSECYGCKFGYGPVAGTNRCEACGANCDYCESSTQCKTWGCSDGFRYDGGACKACPANCDDCASSTQCKWNGCSRGYYYDGGACKACASGKSFVYRRRYSGPDCGTAYTIGFYAPTSEDS